MNRILTTLILAQLTIVGSAHSSNEDLISLAKIYRSDTFSNNTPQRIFQDLLIMQPVQLKTSGVFLAELIKSGNSLGLKKYLSKPNQKTLEHLFIIRSINWNLAETNPMDNNKLIDSLSNSDNEYLVLLACYYNMIWTIGRNDKIQTYNDYSALSPWVISTTLRTPS